VTHEFEGWRKEWPTLTDPIAVAAFEGWNDAGDAASNAVDHLRSVWDAVPVAEIDPDPYYDFQVNRPTVSLGDDGSRHIEWPTTRLYYCKPEGARRDVVLVRGVEPNMRWRAFCDEIVDALNILDVRTVVTLGALLSDSPHTRPTPVSGTAYDEATAAQFGLERSRYEGPTGIVGVLQDACATGGIPAVSFWAAIAHYVAQPPNPKATIALLHRVEEVLDIAVPLADLPQDAEDWQKLVDEMAAEDDEVTEYIRNLEERDEGSDLREASGEAIASEVEKYLRRRDNGGSGLPGSHRPGPRG
jgi:proteasome assembly chaperone (PAC2) family protein